MKIYFTCSFDDGDVNDLRLAELLQKYNLKGTFYIPRTCDLVTKILTDEQIRQLSGVAEIGGHTISHQVLTHITDERAEQEIVDCKSWLEDVTGKEVPAFCPPTGRFSKQHILFQKKAGFRVMRTVEMLSYSLKKIEHTNDFVILPTTSQVYNHTKMAYLKNAAKRFKFGRYSLFGKLYNPDWEVMSNNYISYLNEIAEAGNAAYFFHLWGHSWEIEKYSLWNGLEKLFRRLSEMESIVACDNTTLSEIVRTDRNEG